MTNMEAALAKALANPKPLVGSVKTPNKNKTSPASVSTPSTATIAMHPLPKHLIPVISPAEELEKAVARLIKQTFALDRDVQSADGRTLTVGGILLEKTDVAAELIRRLQARIKLTVSSSGFDLLIVGTYTRSSTVEWTISWSPLINLWLGHLIRRLRLIELCERKAQGDLTDEQFKQLSAMHPCDFPGGDAWAGSFKERVFRSVQVSHLNLQQIFDTMAEAMTERKAIYRPKFQTT